MKNFLRAMVLPVLVLGEPAWAQSLPSTKTAAPRLGISRTVGHRELGWWDDAFACEEGDAILLRRGSDLFELSLTGSANPSKLLTQPALVGTRIVAGAEAGKRRWIFLESEQRGPFALETSSGKMAEFKIPGLGSPAKHFPVIQSHVIASHAAGAILMIAGGEPGWPREGNRPLYFWMSLESGAVVAWPIGWELDYCSRDQRLAVFGRDSGRPFERLLLQGVDMTTGVLVAQVPNRREVPVVEFDWSDTQRVQPLYVSVRRPEPGDRDYIAGITLKGSVLPFELGLEEETYLFKLEANDGFAGFFLRRAGELSPSSFWLTSLSRGQKPELIAAEAADFRILGGGNLVFVSPASRPERNYADVFYRERRSFSVWNVLDGVERLPVLDSELAGKPDIEDVMGIRLVGGFGGDAHTRLALCLFHQYRADRRDFPLDGAGPRVAGGSWRRAVLVTSDEQRSMTDLFRDGVLPEQIWLHNSGRVISGKYRWDANGAAEKRQVQLREDMITLPRKVVEL